MRETLPLPRNHDPQLLHRASQQGRGHPRPHRTHGGWWENHLPRFGVYISPIVLDEIDEGNPDKAQERLRSIDTFPILEANEETETLTDAYFRELRLPPKAIRDAAHLAFACAHGMDYLLTWNCRHIANAELRFRLQEYNMERGVRTPVICTPEELMGMEDSSDAG